MTGNGKHTTYKNGDIGDGLWRCLTNIYENKPPINFGVDTSTTLAIVWSHEAKNT
jgi:hypothetical protein